MTIEVGDSRPAAAWVIAILIVVFVGWAIDAAWPSPEAQKLEQANP